MKMFTASDPSAGTDPNAPQNPAFGFYYKTVPHITLKSIAQNKALDAIFARHEPLLAEKLAALNAELQKISRGDAEARRKLREKLVRKLLAKHEAEGANAVTDADKRRWLLPDTDPQLIQPSKKISAKQVAAYRAAIPKEKILRASAPPREKNSVEGVGWQPWQAPFDSDPDWPAELSDALAAYRAARRSSSGRSSAA
jgi:adenine-specific DNA-methyltransferase